jgi:hypothetical protein
LVCWRIEFNPPINFINKIEALLWECLYFVDEATRIAPSATTASPALTLVKEQLRQIWQAKLFCGSIGFRFN